MEFVTNFFGVIASITSCIGLIPQIYKTAKTKSASGISMLMLVNFFICSISWIVYGICTGTVFVVFSNVVGFITSLTSIIQKIHYDSQ